MPRYNKKEDFELGLSQLIPFFESRGFSLSQCEPYTDKAGTSYSARFVRFPRSIELSHLYSLGPVVYSIREFSVEHTFYIQALGKSAAAQFPSFVDDSTSGYPAMLHDLQNLLSPFFTGPEENFIAIAKRYMHEQRQQQERDTRDLAYHSTGEHRLKARARELFRQGRYNEIVEIESQIAFPELLTSSEQQIFAVARRRSRGKT
jgi:hypothetical protein